MARVALNDDGELTVISSDEREEFNVSENLAKLVRAYNNYTSEPLGEVIADMIKTETDVSRANIKKIKEYYCGT